MLLQGLTNHLGGHLGFQVFVVVNLFLLHAQLILMTLHQSCLMNLRLTLLQLNRRTQLSNLILLLLNSLLCLATLFHDSQLHLVVVLLDGRVQLCNSLVLLSQSQRQLTLLLSLDVLQLTLQACNFCILFTLHFSQFRLSRRLQTTNLSILITQFHLLAAKLLLERLFCLGSSQFLLSLMTLMKFGKATIHLCVKLCILNLANNACIVSFIYLENLSTVRALKFFHNTGD